MKIQAGIYSTNTKIRRGKADIWRNFSIVTDKDENELDFVCCLWCAKVLTFKGRKSGTSGLRRHVCSVLTGQMSDVERRSRSLRTQYGRVLYHPERIHTAQQEMLREKLDFLRPYIVRRRGDPQVGEKFDDREEDNEELETEGSIDQEMGSSFGSPLDANVTGQDLDDEPQPVSYVPNPAPLQPQPQVTDVMSLSCPHHHDDEESTDQPANTSKHDLLSQFAEVMLADMRHIKDPMVLMRLRRDITDLVFRAVEEDMQRRCNRALSVPSAQSGISFRPQQACSQTHFSWRQRFMKRKNKTCEVGRKMQRWEGAEHAKRNPLSQPVQQGQTLEGTGENSSQVIIQATEIKRETEPHTVKIEEETLQLA